MVILAAVSINAAFNTGIIDTAVNGAVNYAEAQRQEQVTFDELDSNLQDILNRINEYDVGGSVPTERPNPELEAPKQDGSWDSARRVNTPKIVGTGLTPVYYNGTSWVDLTSSSTKAEWNSWFNYDTQKWANARTADGSMWVWIPRYEYKINTTAKTIDVRFISSDTKAGTTGYTTDSTTGIVKSSDDYIIHPAFMDDTANSFNNGGWDSDIPGFWVAKYPAGWQNGTNDVGTSLGSADMSNLVYQTSASSSTYAGTISNNSTKMSYPVFKADTYAYNYITEGDAYVLSQDIKNATRYGLNNSKVDSHLEKNSEWGAVAYLAHSKYGVNGQDLIAKNTTSKGNTLTGIKAVTSPESTVNTSTTQNITGVYDLSGCILEYTAGFYKEGNTSNTIGMPTETASKYVALYKSNDKKGDATIETSGWNNDSETFINSTWSVFTRGGAYYVQESSCGVFNYGYGGYANDASGFRAVLIPN